MSKNSSNKIFIILYLILLSSCGGNGSSGKVKVSSEFERTSFFNIAYETGYFRPMGSSSSQDWQPAFGCRELKFSSNISVASDSDLPANLNGEFIVALQSFNPESSQNKCSGGNKGNYTLLSIQSQPSGSLDSSYHPPIETLPPFSEYDHYSTLPPARAESSLKGTANIYKFQMMPSQETTGPLTQACSGQIYCGNREANSSIDQDRYPCDYSFDIVLFTDGSIIVDDISKQIQYYLKPRPANDSFSICSRSNIPR